jgi:hypothetical protein
VLANHIRWPRPRSRHGAVRVARTLWTLPTNLLGHLAGRLVSGHGPRRRVGGPVAVGWLYPIRRGIGLDWVGAVTLGHAILYRRGVLDRPSLAARLTLAHELAHTRQHDWLGPLYLPLHLVAQAISALLSVASSGLASLLGSRGRRPVVSRVHDYNPLEQTFICLSAGATSVPLPDGVDAQRYLEVFGL